MPPRKPKLPFGITSLAPFSISEDQWEKLETDSGLTFPSDLRSIIVARTQRMGWLSESWQSALPISDTIKQIAGVRRTTADWLKRIDELPPEVAAMIMPVGSEKTDDVIKPFMKLVVTVCDEQLGWLASIKEDDQDARNPLGAWIVELVNAFKDHGLPAKARKDVDKIKNGHSPFTIVIYELLQLIGRPAHSLETVAEAINLAKAGKAPPASKPVKTTKRKAIRPFRPFSGDE